MTHEHSELIKNIKASIKDSIEVTSTLLNGNWKPKVRIEFVVSNEDVSDICDRPIVSQIIGDLIYDAIKQHEAAEADDIKYDGRYKEPEERY